MNVHPILFEPIYKPKIWGGRRIADILGKPLPDGQHIGESWELSDLPGNESVVREGPCRGHTLHRVMETWGDSLLGGVRPVQGRFPLLVKFLDADQDLSVQVHPPPHVAAVEPNAHLKNEAWYVIAAEPGAAIYRGFVPGVTRDQFIEALNDGDVARLMRRIPVRPGDSYYLPSGTIHALGAGVLVAEVQTPSDTTYRLFDWNRVDEATGRPRELHVEQALKCIDFDASAEPDPPRVHSADVWKTVTRLVACEQFVIEKVRMIDGADHPLPYGGPAVWIMLDGRAEITHGDGGVTVQRGDVVLLPAAMRDARVRAIGPTIWLDVSIPVRGSART